MARTLRAVLLGGLLLGVTTLASALALPIAGFGDLPAPYRGNLAACVSGDMVMVIDFEVQAVPYRLLLSNQDTQPQRFILLDMTQGDDTTPAWVGIMQADGLFVVKEELSFSQLLVKYPDACRWLVNIQI